jgi:uncharacterized protein Yka (UPF0111/DUF47 family)
MTDTNNDLNSFLNTMTENNIEKDIYNIVSKNYEDYKKLQESINMLDEILAEEKQNKDKILEELQNIKNIQNDVDQLFKNIIDSVKIN